MSKNFYDYSSSAKKISTLLLWIMTISLVGCSKGSANSTNEVPKEIWVNDVGANGGDILNDTWAFQKAIDSMASLGGGIVKVRTGKYYIDVDTSIKMRSHVTLYMFDTTRKLIAIPTYSGRYKVISIENVTDATIMGGKIIGEREKHLGPECPHKCEQGYGIGIYGSSNIKVTRTYITDCWGDGIMVARSGSVGNKNITLFRVTCSNNRRQGLSILNVDSLMVDSCAFLNTHGTAPQDGIDIEPDAGTVQNVTIKNCLISNNAGNGVEMNAKPTTSAVIKNITVQNNIIQNSKYAGYIQHTSNVVFNNNTFQEIRYGPHVKANDCIGCTLEPNTDK